MATTTPVREPETQENRPSPDGGASAGRDRPNALGDRLKKLPFRNEGLGLALLVILIPLLPKLPGLNDTGTIKSIPLAVYALGIPAGCTLAVQALGIVLVYRTNRFINFGQVFIGAFAASLFSLGVNYGAMYRWIGGVCVSCAENPSAGLRLFNYWFWAVISFAVGIALSWLVYTVVIKRFDGSPRLVVMIASIFISSALQALYNPIQNTLTTREQREDGLNRFGAPLPKWFESWTITIDNQRIHANDILLILFTIGIAVALYAYFRFSATGTAIRASSENAGRAETLGVNVNSVNTRVWLIVGVLSTIPAMLGIMGPSGGDAGGLSFEFMARILLIAIFARFVSLPMAAIAGVVLGVLQASVLYTDAGSTVFLDGAMVFLVGGLLLLRSRERESRAEIESSGGWRATREVRPIPAELRSLPSVRKWLRISALVAGTLVLGFPWAMSPGQTTLAAVVLIYAICNISLLILTGWAGQVSLGQFGFAAIGGYVAARWNLPFLVAIPAGAIAGALAATLVGIPALRLRGLYLAISTLAFAISVSAIVVNPRFLGKKLPATLDKPRLLGLDFENEKVFYYFCLVCLVGTVFAVVGLRRSRTGRALIACRENEQAAQSFGISLVRLRLTAFAMSGFIAAFAGVLYAYSQSGVKVSGFNTGQSFLVFNSSVIGGLGSVSGPILGALYYGFLLLFGANEFISALFLGFGALGLLLLMPGGLSQAVFNIRDAILRRVAKRHRIIAPSLLADQRAARLDKRGALAPKMRSGGGSAFVAERYTLEDQWALHVGGEVPEDDGRAPADAFGGVNDEDDASADGGATPALEGAGRG